MHCYPGNASGNWVITDPCNGLWPVRRQAIAYTNTDSLSIGLTEKWFTKKLNPNTIFISREYNWKVSHIFTCVSVLNTLTHEKIFDNFEKCASVGTLSQFWKHCKALEDRVQKIESGDTLGFESMMTLWHESAFFMTRPMLGEIHGVLADSPHKGRVTRVLTFSLMLA